MNGVRQSLLVGPARKMVVVVEGSRAGGWVSFGVMSWIWAMFGVLLKQIDIDLSRG